MDATVTGSQSLGARKRAKWVPFYLCRVLDWGLGFRPGSETCRENGAGGGGIATGANSQRRVILDQV